MRWGGRKILDDNKIEALIARWSGLPGGAERKNFAPFIYDLIDALGLPRPEPGQAGRLGDYEFEGSVAGGSAKLTGQGGSADLYKRGCFVMEAKQSYLAQGEKSQPQLFGDGQVIPISPSGATYDRLMVRAQAQAKNYAVNLPGDHPSVPFLIVCDVGRAFELFFDFAGNGRGYGFFPDKQRYRIPIARLREPEVQALFRAIWEEPRSLDPRLKAAEVTREVSKRLAEVSKALEASNRYRARALAAAGKESEEIEETALFLMRILFCMFAEDIGLLPQDSFKAFLEEAVENGEWFERGLQDLWAAMGQPARSDRFSSAIRAQVRYFNGGLFENNRVFALTNADRGELLAAAQKQWRNVEPAIFGTLLEQALPSKERSKLGAHYTPRAYVERLVEATIMDVLNAEWDQVQEAIAGSSSPLPEGEGDSRDGASGVRGGDLSGNARSPHPDALPRVSTSPNGRGEGDGLAAARAFHDRLAAVRVLDPACGTGNFLYVAMEAIERLEARVIETIEQLGGTAAPRVDPHQFYGLELNPRAAKIAELVLWIGWLRFRIQNNPDAVPEPVLARGANINFGRHGGYDAVLHRTETGEPDFAHPLQPDWPEAEFIIGNPPFIGGKDLRDRLGGDYAEALWAANPRVPKSADFVMQWWDRAAHILTRPGSRLERFGFVTTNSITQEFSRRVIAGYLSAPLPEGEGDSRERASGVRGSDPSGNSRSPHPDALPRVSTSPQGRGGEEQASLSLVFAIPDHPWTKASADAAAVRIAMTVAERGAKDGLFAEVVREAKLDSDAPEVELAKTIAPIRANLAVGADVTSVAPLLANEGLCSPGVKLHGAGFIVTPAEAEHLGLGRREGLEQHIRRYRHGADIMQRTRGVMVIDLDGLSEREVRQRYPEVYQHLLFKVKPERDSNREAYRRDNWWLFGRKNTLMRGAIAGLGRYVATPETAKHRVFVFLDGDILPDNMVTAFGLETAFDLGVLSSRIHTAWALQRGGTLEDRPRYTKGLCFDPFPFPDPTPAQRAAIAELAEELDATRKAALAEVPKLTMTELYNLRERLRAGGLGPTEAARAMAARAGIVDRLHDQIDRAVADAYGWPHELPPSEIVARLVALNAERAAEERAGHVRWLRPDYQAARFGK